MVEKQSCVLHCTIIATLCCLCSFTFKCCEHVLDTVYSHALCKPCIRPALGILYVRLEVAMGVISLRPGYALSTATI